jgi:2-oxoglutarate dehydrogenase complex dehydrogenase (E1) component-like enzyme
MKRIEMRMRKELMERLHDAESGEIYTPLAHVTEGEGHGRFEIYNSPLSESDGVWSIYFNTVLLATLNERDYIIRG